MANPFSLRDQWFESISLQRTVRVSHKPSCRRSRTAGFPRECAAGLAARSAETRRRVGSARTSTDISVESYSSTAMLLTWSRVITAVAAEPRCYWAQLLKAKPSMLRCSCQASGRRECTNSLFAVRSRG